MMASFFTFIKSLFLLGEHVVSSVQTKLEDNQDHIKAKLDSASEQIRRKCGISKDTTNHT